MENHKENLTGQIIKILREFYKTDRVEPLIQLQKTRKDFSGDFTLVVFPLLKISKKSPEETGVEIGEELKKKLSSIHGYNIIKGFLNIELTFNYWLDVLKRRMSEGFPEFDTDLESTVVVEYSSPNTNKPLHLGHIRNNLIGFSLSRILRTSARNVLKVNIVNDRGIHICKSMLAWMKWGDNETPEKSGKKGDHLVGDYYVKFDQEYKKQVDSMVRDGVPEDKAIREAPLILEAQDLLRKWENQDPETRKLWEMMNGWVYDGFDETYKAMGVDFDKIYYESDTYEYGRSLVMEGVENRIFEEREDRSVWIDLSSDGLDSKLLLRSDGTSVYITQDIGTAHQRYEDYKFDKHIYVVGNEQNYHFQVLKIILEKMNFPWAKDLYHLSYGMVELPHGKMKSREGTVVDADLLIEEMIETAREMSAELGKLDEYNKQEKQDIFRVIGLGALKYFILKVDPKKNMLFNPEESIDFNGNTGPFIQYTYARIQSIFRKAKQKPEEFYKKVDYNKIELLEIEKKILRTISEFPQVVKNAGDNLSPAIIANYCYELVKIYNHYYQDTPILKRTNKDTANFRVSLSWFVGNIVKQSSSLLGITLPDRM